MQIRITFDAKEVLQFCDNSVKRLSPGHLMYMNRHIAGRVIHAAITHNFLIEGRNRPRKWAALSPIYAKIKAQIVASGKNRTPNVQRKDLGKVPTPWGNIGVRYGRLFHSLGSIFRVTDKEVVYGTNTPYASSFIKGSTVKQIATEKTVKKDGESITKRYIRKLGSRGIKVPGRDFTFMTQHENDVIARAMLDYAVAPVKRKTVIIGRMQPKIYASGGQRVYIRGKGG